METIWAAVIGAVLTLVLAVIAAAWTLASRLGRLQRAVEGHSHVLENGLTAKVEDNRVAIAGIHEHQRAQDDRLKEIAEALKIITARLERLPCHGQVVGD